MREGFKLWQEFASTYSSMVFDAMNRAIQQSDALKEQMDEAVQRSMKGWKMPQASGADVAEAIDRLSAQIRSLADKVDRLEQRLQAGGGATQGSAAGGGTTKGSGARTSRKK